MSKIYLFTSKTCIHCPTERKYLEEKNISFEEIDVYSNEFESFKEDLQKNGIALQYVPAIVREDNHKMSLIGRQDL